MEPEKTQKPRGEEVGSKKDLEKGRELTISDVIKDTREKLYLPSQEFPYPFIKEPNPPDNRFANLNILPPYIYGKDLKKAQRIPGIS